MFKNTKILKSKKKKEIHIMNNKKTKTKSSKQFSQKDIHTVIDNKEKIFGILKNEKLLKFLKDVKLYLRLLYDILTSRIINVPNGIIAAIVGALLFLLSPFDFIPDWIPGIGYMDDALILSICQHFTKSFVKKYKKTAGE